VHRDVSDMDAHDNWTLPVKSTNVDENTRNLVRGGGSPLRHSAPGRWQLPPQGSALQPSAAQSKLRSREPHLSRPSRTQYFDVQDLIPNRGHQVAHEALQIAGLAQNDWHGARTNLVTSEATSHSSLQSLRIGAGAPEQAHELSRASPVSQDHSSPDVATVEHNRPPYHDSLPHSSSLTTVG
jgi:hypothetical protein